MIKQAFYFMIWLYMFPAASLSEDCHLLEHITILGSQLSDINASISLVSR